MRLARLVFACRALPPLVALAAAVCAPAWAGPKNVPFKASATTQEVLRVDPGACVAPPYLAGTTTGSGVASHLGKITFVGGDCITPGPTSFTFGNGSFTITAANGDELTAVYEGSLQPIAGAPPFTLHSVSGSFTITGGTGRFLGASGSGYLGGSQNIQTGTGHFQLTGSLSY